MVRVSGHSMLDCPEQTQTSPMRMSSMMIRLRPVITILCGPLFPGGSKVVRQTPPRLARRVANWPANSMVIFSPGLAQPHNFTGFPSCSTICNGIHVENNNSSKIWILFIVRAKGLRILRIESSIDLIWGGIPAKFKQSLS